MNVINLPTQKEKTVEYRNQRYSWFFVTLTNTFGLFSISGKYLSTNWDPSSSKIAWRRLGCVSCFSTLTANALHILSSTYRNNTYHGLATLNVKSHNSVSTIHSVNFISQTNVCFGQKQFVQCNIYCINTLLGIHLFSLYSVRNV